MSKYTGRVPRVYRQMPADFEEIYLRTKPKMPELMKKYKAGNSTIERWIDEVNIRRAERIRGRK